MSYVLFGRSLAKGLGRAFRSYLFARILSKRITAAIPNASPRFNYAARQPPNIANGLRIKIRQQLTILRLFKFFSCLITKQ
jgi:hypothetical protein